MGGRSLEERAGKGCSGRHQNRYVAAVANGRPVQRRVGWLRTAARHADRHVCLPVVCRWKECRLRSNSVMRRAKSSASCMCAVRQRKGRIRAVTEISVWMGPQGRMQLRKWAWASQSQ